MKSEKSVEADKEIPKLYIRHMAKFGNCSNGTVLNYERRGIIKPVRDHNGFRRYTRAQAIMLRELVNLRIPL